MNTKRFTRAARNRIPGGSSFSRLSLCVHFALFGTGVLISCGAMAQVDGVTDLSTLPAPTDDTVWSLEGDVTNSGTITLPVGTPGLTINGNGYTLELTPNDDATSPTYGYFSNATASPVTLNLSDITLTGGNQHQPNDGGAIYSNGALTIEGSFAASQNHSLGNGGAICTDGDLLIEGSVTANQNSAITGGAIYAAGALTIEGALTASQNSARGYGGSVLWALSGDITVTGNVSLDGNTSGAIEADYGGGSVFLGTDVGSNVSLTNTTNSSYSIPGGAVVAKLGSVTIGNSAGTVVLSGNNSSSEFGGGIYSFGLTTIIGSLTATGNQTNEYGGAIYTEGGLTLNATGPTTFSCNTQNGGQPNAIYLDGADEVATFTAEAGQAIVFHDPIQSDVGGDLATVSVDGAGQVVFDGEPEVCGTSTITTNTWSQIYADTTVSNGTMVVENGATYGALAADVGQSAPSSFVLDAGARLAGGNTLATVANSVSIVRADNLTLDGGTLDVSGSRSIGNPAGTAAGGFSTINLLATNALDLPTPTPDTITTGSVTVGGTVEINTCLNSGTPQRSDVLAISTNGGTAGDTITGTANIVVTPVAGCAGAPTTGNGILLVQADGQNPPASFALANGQVVSSDRYLYTLVQVGNDWYLQSTRQLPAPVPAPALGKWALALLALTLAAIAVRRKWAW